MVGESRLTLVFISVPARGLLRLPQAYTCGVSWPRTLSIAALPLAVGAAAAGVAGLMAAAQPEGVRWFLLGIAMALPALVMGLIITSRQPRNSVGAFLSLAGLTAVAVSSFDVYLEAAIQQPEPPQTLGWLVASTQGSWMALYLPWACLLLVFPNGRLHGKLGRVAAIGLPIVFIAFNGLAAVSPGTYPDPFSGVPHPFGVVPGAQYAAVALLPVFFGLLVTAVVSSIRRYRDAGSDERVQLRLFALSGVSLPAALMVGWSGYLLAGTPEITVLGITVIYFAIPAAVAIAVLRTDLYRVDQALLGSLVYSALAVGLTGIVAAVSVLTGLAVGRESVIVAVALTAVTVLSLNPLRMHLKRWLSTWLYPEHERVLIAVRELEQRVHAGISRPEELQQVLRSVLHDPGLLVGYAFPDSEVLLDADGVPVMGTPRTVPVRLAGRRIAAIVPGSGSRYTPDSEVGQAVALLAEMVRLRMELSSALHDVAASRARLLEAGYEERQRLERDLHDGAQQRLVALGMSLRLAQRHLPQGSADLHGVLDTAVAELGTAVAELRHIAHGIRPSSLNDGLPAALAHLSSTSPLPIDLDLDSHQLPDAVNTTAYFVASEAVTNAVKYAAATRIALRVAQLDGRVSIRVSDDGDGGAAVRPGGGLAGLVDRVSAMGGSLQVVSPAGRGTMVEAVLPCGF